jgi:hypothetical protein
MAAEDPDLLEILMQVKCRDVNTDEGCDFVVDDGCIRFLNITRTVESLQWQLLLLRR